MFAVLAILDSNHEWTKFVISNNVFHYQDALTDLTGQQEELNIEGFGTCHAHKVHRMSP